MSSRENTEHQLLLKVCQLPRPTIAIPQIITCDEEDFPGNSMNDFLIKDVTVVKDLECVAAGQFLFAPQTLQSIYLDETFYAYLYVYNRTRHEVKNVSLKVDVIDNSQSIPVYMYIHPKCVLGPGDSLSHVVSYKMKSLNMHTLNCEISYLHSLSEKSVSYKKRYPFNVMELFDVKPTFKYFDNSDDILLQIEITNKSTEAVWLEKVSPNFSDNLNVISLNVETENMINLSPNDCYQFLYSLIPIPGKLPDFHQLMPTQNAGVLDIQWSSRTAGCGRITSVQLKSKYTCFDDIKVSFTLPPQVKLEEAFEFKCKIDNTCERVIDLFLKLSSSEDGAFFWSGISNTKICHLESGDSTEITLCAFPLIPGIQKITGLSLVDMSLNYTYNFDDAIDVYVQ